MKIGDKYTFETANREYSYKHNAFVSAACANVVSIIEKYKSVKDPKKINYALVETETVKTGTEEDKALFLDLKTSQEFLPLLAAPLAPGAIAAITSIAAVVAKAGLILVGVIVALLSVRYVYYSLSCLKVDLVKALTEQSNLVLENIDKLKLNLSKMKEGSPEYVNLNKIILNQEKYLSIVIDICNKMSDEDVYNAKKIADRELEDDETIDSTDSDTNKSITSFDI
jgi:hypothetical protein